MKRTRIVAGMTIALIASLGTPTLSASAQPAAHASSCKLGKEAQGCKLNGTAYYQPSSRVLVGFVSANAPKGTRTTLTVPSEFACPQVTGLQLSVKTKQTAKIGGSLSFSGAVTIENSSASGTSEVKSATITGKLKISSAKLAHLSGHVEVTLSSGAKCSKQLPSKLTRVLGG